MTTATAPMSSALVFSALGDEHRLALLQRLADEGRTATGALAADLPITRQAVSKHLRVLERAGLITSVAAGREVLHDVRPDGLAPVAEWLDEARAAWRRRLVDLKARAEEQLPDGQPPSRPSS